MRAKVLSFVQLWYPHSLQWCLMLSVYRIFWTIRHTPPPQIWEENGGACYSPNVAYLACWGLGMAVEWGFFSPIFLL